MNEYKINIPRIKLPKKFAKSPAKYLRKIVIDHAEGRGLLTSENREEYLQRIDYEIVMFERCGYVEYLLGVVKMIEEMSLRGDLVHCRARSLLRLVGLLLLANYEH